MSGLFRKASMKHAKLRLSFNGVSGSGKTWTSLEVGTGLLNPGERLCFIDTERGSAEKYSNRFDFDVCQLASFDPIHLVNILSEAEAAGYKVCVIDSLSHFWVGKDGALEKVDAVAKRSKSGNNFTAWREVTPQHNMMIDAILQSGMHIIATMRTKSEWVMETNANGKMVPRKVGLAPIQRDGVEYEFDIVGDIDSEHNLIISKTRCDALDGRVYHKPGREFVKIIRSWLESGSPQRPAPVPVQPQPVTQVSVPDVTSPQSPTPLTAVDPIGEIVVEKVEIPQERSNSGIPASSEDISKIRDLFNRMGGSEDDVTAAAVKRGFPSIESITVDVAREILFKLNAIVDADEVFGVGTAGPAVQPQTVGN